MENISSTLMLSGLLAGAVNFFSNYIDLPFSKSNNLDTDEPPKLKDIWWIAIIGYFTVGVAGSFLTPLINALVGGLKGLEWITENNNIYFKDVNHYILFGYGLVFGYSTTRLLISLLDSITKKISLLESRLKRIEANNEQIKVRLNTTAKDIIGSSERNFEANKDNCSAFVKAVASDFSINLTGQADQIIDQIRKEEWVQLEYDGVRAKEMADNGWFVIAGLKSDENVPVQDNGHVAIIVSGGLAQQKYPTGYWGKLNSAGERNKTINWAWNKDSRDKVKYSCKQV